MPGLVFIGPSAVGKSSVGRLVAKMLSYKFIDADAEIERRCGVPVSWIFELEGEQGFRAHETRFLESLGELHGMVLATGGGMVASERNRHILGNLGVVVYLSASPEQLAMRIGNDKNRPLLQGDNRRQIIESMMAKREPLYNSLADIQLPTSDSKSARETAGRLMDMLRENYPQFAGDAR